MKTISLSLSLLMIAAPAVAQTNTVVSPRALPPALTNNAIPNVGFPSLDLNNDGSVSRLEFTSAGLSGTLFTTLDTNHDNLVSRAEMRRYGPVARPAR